MQERVAAAVEAVASLPPAVPVAAVVPATASSGGHADPGAEAGIEAEAGAESGAGEGAGTRGARGAESLRAALLAQLSRSAQVPFAPSRSGTLAPTLTPAPTLGPSPHPRPRPRPNPHRALSLALSPALAVHLTDHCSPNWDLVWLEPTLQAQPWSLVRWPYLCNVLWRRRVAGPRLPLSPPASRRPGRPRRPCLRHPPAAVAARAAARCGRGRLSHSGAARHLWRLCWCCSRRSVAC